MATCIAVAALLAKSSCIFRRSDAPCIAEVAVHAPSDLWVFSSILLSRLIVLLFRFEQINDVASLGRQGNAGQLEGFDEKAHRVVEFLKRDCFVRRNGMRS